MLPINPLSQNEWSKIFQFLDDCYGLAALDNQRCVDFRTRSLDILKGLSKAYLNDLFSTKETAFWPEAAKSIVIYSDPRCFARLTTPAVCPPYADEGSGEVAANNLAAIFCWIVSVMHKDSVSERAQAEKIFHEILVIYSLIGRHYDLLSERQKRNAH